MSTKAGSFDDLLGVMETYLSVVRELEEYERVALAALFGVGAEDILLPHERDLADRYEPSVLVSLALQ